MIPVLFLYSFEVIIGDIRDISETYRVYKKTTFVHIILRAVQNRTITVQLA